MADTARAAAAVAGAERGRARRLAAALGLGGLFALGQAPFDLWPLALMALAGVFLVLRPGLRPAQAGWTGWAFGVGYFGLSMHWIVEPFMVDAAVTGWMAPFGLVGLAGGLALFWALPVWAAFRLRAPLLLVPLWALSELARAYVLTGFPWGLVGYVFVPTHAAQWAAWIGPHGLTLAALAVAALAARAASARSLPAAAGAAALLALLLGGGWALRPAPQDLDGRPVVRLVQPNAPQHEKWRRDLIPEFFRRQVDATAAGEVPDLVVWPETAVPMPLDHAGEAFDIIAEAARGAPVVLGIQRDDAGRYYNSAVSLGTDGRLRDIYDKHHLVPFGEYMPAAWLFRQIEVSGLAARASGGFSPGPGPRLMDLGPLGTALPLICYEAVFPRDARGAGGRPALLLQITNDAWFGRFSGPYQHLAQARMRAIEQGLPLARAANTGVSAMIDARGALRRSLELDRAGHVDAKLPAALAPTPYARTGDAPLVLLLLGLIGWQMMRARRRRHVP